MLTCAQNHRNNTIRISQLMHECRILSSPGRWKLCSHCLKCSFSPSPRLLHPGCRSELGDAGSGQWRKQATGVFPVAGSIMLPRPWSDLLNRGGPKLTGPLPALPVQTPHGSGCCVFTWKASLHAKTSASTCSTRLHLKAQIQ